MAQTMMTRIELSPDEWAAIRKLAIDERTTTQKLIGDVLRALLLEKAAA